MFTRLLNFVLLVLIPAFSIAQVNLNQGLVAYYPFNGNANDASGNGNNAIFNNATLTADYYGNPNSAYHFNGVDNYIQIPNSNSLNFGNTISICAWVKPTGFYSGQCYNNMLVCKQISDFTDGDISLRFSDPVNGCNSNADSSKELFYGPGGSTGSSQDFIKKNQWYNVVFTADGTTVNLYVNCKLVVSQPQNNSSFSNPYDLFLGHFDNASYPYWLNGDLDEVRIYNRALNADEVEAYSATCKTQSDVTASFTSLDSICAGTPINFTNTSINATNYYWSFCAAGFNTTPDATNIGDPNNTLNSPVFMDYILDDNGNYYGFITNYNYGHLIRLDYGNSLLNNPTAEDLGNLNVIPSYSEGVQVKKFNGQCYVFIVSAGNEFGTASSLTRINFGNSFSNPPSSATSLGNVGGLNFPHELFITENNSNYYGFTVNINDNTITRFDFGNSLTNQPTGINLGNIGTLNYPCGFSFINTNGNWYAFIANRNNNSISRLSFGNSLSNTPTGINLGNPSGILYRPRDLSIFESCNGIAGLVVNEEDETTGEITKLDFGSDILSTNPTATNLGNIGELKFPHSISKFFLEKNDIYSFITNVANNTITRIRYAGCTNSNIPSSTQQTPPSVTYSSPGVYNVNLLVDIGLPTETSFCKQIAVKDCSPVVTASFTAPDSVCNKTPIKITNTSTNASSYFWSFCSGLSTTPNATNIGNPNDQLSNPVFTDFGLDDDGNYYAITTNHLPGKIIRLNFGKSLLNTPTAEDLGNFNDIVPNQVEGIQLLKVKGNWYAIIVGGGDNVSNSSPRILKLSFGNSLANIPDATNWGNIGDLGLPIDFQIFQENGNYYGFTTNLNSNTITRFDFGTDFINPPSGINLGKIGNLNYPDGFSFIKYKNNWYAFVVNGLSNSITRLNFGSSLTNTPAANEIANLSEFLNQPRDIMLLNTCNGVFGYVSNANGNNLIKLNFGDDPTSLTPTAIDLGNIGNFSLPHSFSKLFSSGNNIYTFITNASNNDVSGVSISRLKFSSCQSIAGSNKQNPDPITYDSSGVYNISLLVDIGLPTQTSYCKQIVVKNCGCDSLKVSAGKDVSICYGTSIQLHATGAATYKWNASSALSDTTIANPIATPKITTSFIVTGHDNAGICSDTDTVKVTILPLPVFNLSNDTTICRGNAIQLTANAVKNYHYHWSPVSYLSDTSISNPTANPTDSIEYYVTASDSSSCQSKDSIHINVAAVPTIATINNSSVCFGDTILLSTTSTNANTYLWSPSLGLSNPSILSPKASPASSTKYFIRASNNVCSSKDSVLITVKSLPLVSAGNDTTACGVGMAQLHASGANTYLWQPVTGLSNPNIGNPIASPASTTIYYVTGTDNNGCKKSDSVIVDRIPNPVFNISISDSSVCSGQTVSLTASGGDVYAWSPSQLVNSPSSATTSTYPSTTTNFSVNIYNNICKVSKTLDAIITVEPSPKVTVSKSNDVDCSNLQAQLNASGGTSYSWLPSTNIDNTQIPKPVVNPSTDTWYTVTATNSYGCVSIDSILVKSVTGNQGFYVPNAFTPNGDGLNDCFGLRYWGIPATFDMKIFDKWGMQVFHSTNISECWNGTYQGKKQGSGTFVYLISATSVCGQQKVFKKGTIVLIR